MKRLAALCVALLLTMLVAAPVTAGKPVVIFDGDYDQEVEVDSDWIDCGFDVIWGSAAHTNYKLWYDKDGNPIKGLYKHHGRDWFYAEAKPDNVVEGTFSNLLHQTNFNKIGPDLYEWDERETGSIWGIQIPGSGAFFQQAGQVWTHAIGTPGPGGARDEVRTVGHFTIHSDKLCAALDPS